ncbi:MAG: hypothetical protein M3Z05_14825 [Gemmatimonadota bacterium]|nr:hypothetical protein [Gemmatimonadota bacterium]
MSAASHDGLVRMSIDDCEHSFEDLASHILPRHMDRLRAALAAPWPTAAFAQQGKGTKAVAAQFGLLGDFSGCYTLIEDARPVYVGISRSVLARVRQHVLGRSHFDASLAYLIAQRRLPTKGQRAKNMDNPEFRAAFVDAQEYLRGLHVATVRIDNPLELHVFEAYAAMALGTCEWNSFRTH